MNASQLQRLVHAATCRAFGWEEASNDAHRTVLASLIRNLTNESSTVLCEPSLARSTHRPPDVVLVCPVAGLHVIEVKGVAITDIASVEPGGQFVIEYASGARSRNPFVQVRNAMFDIRDAAQRAFSADFTLPFRYWVVMPRISRVDWGKRWGEWSVAPRELLFLEDLPGLADHLTAIGKRQLDCLGEKFWPAVELSAIYRAFGDSSVLFPGPMERELRRTREATLGEMFDDAAETYKALSDEQQALSTQFWERGPRLIRGVAGSGKTVVLANNLARRIERNQRQGASLFEAQQTTPRILAVCFNRTLVPFILRKIEIAFRQRTGRELPTGIVEVVAYNRLMWKLAQAGLWRYQRVDDMPDGERVLRYLQDLQHVKEHDASTSDRLAYDAIYVDEGQDFAEEDFRLLSELCRRQDDEPSLFVFYDDAQNLYGRKRPNWQSLGLNLVGGRSHVMSECFRNTRETVEAAFNVLYGSFSPANSQVPTKAYGDLASLEERQLIERDSGIWRVLFTKRRGLKPKVTVAGNQTEEWNDVIQRLRWLTEEQDVRPEDIHILVYYKNQVAKLVKTLEGAKLSAIEGIHDATARKDEVLRKRRWLSISTVASAKGYDAYCVLLANADQFPADVQGRATFYVACTRAIEYLEVFAASRTSLVVEMEHAVAALQ